MPPKRDESSSEMTSEYSSYSEDEAPQRQVRANGNQVESNNPPQEELQPKQKGKKGKKGKGDAGGNKMKGVMNKMDGTMQKALGTARGAFGGHDVQRIGIHFLVFFSFLHFMFVLLACVLSQLDVRGGACFTYWGYKSDCDHVSYTTRPELFLDGSSKGKIRATAAFSIFSVILSILFVGGSWVLCCRLRRAIRIAQRKAISASRSKRNAHHSGADEELDEIPEREEDRLTSGENPNNASEPQVHMVFAVGITKWVMVVIIGGGCVCELICWAIIAGVYSQRPHSTKILTGADVPLGTPRDVTYGVGFGLSITAWILQVIVLVLFVVLI